MLVGCAGGVIIFDGVDVSLRSRAADSGGQAGAEGFSCETGLVRNDRPEGSRR